MFLFPNYLPAFSLDVNWPLFRFLLLSLPLNLILCLSVEKNVSYNFYVVSIDFYLGILYLSYFDLPFIIFPSHLLIHLIYFVFFISYIVYIVTVLYFFS